MILEFRAPIRRADNPQVRKHPIRIPQPHREVRCVRADTVSLAYLCTQSIRDGGAPVTKLTRAFSPIEGDWFLRSLGIAIANNVMRDRFSSTFQRTRQTTS